MLQDILVYPEIEKEDVEHLNHMVQPIEKFFAEGSKILAASRENLFVGFLTRYYINQAIQPQNLCSENKDTDQLQLLHN